MRIKIDPSNFTAEFSRVQLKVEGRLVEGIKREVSVLVIFRS